MRNAEARAAAEQSTPRMNAWRDAFAGKRNNAASPVTVAQPEFGKGGGAGEGARVGPRLQHLAERANLTPAQVDTLAAALHDERAQIAVLRQQRQDGTLTHEQARAQIDAIRSQTDSQLENVLNAEQQAAFSEMRQRRAEARAGKGALASEPVP
jgi:Spy/CpxP family protein refolding chaperone